MLGWLPTRGVGLRRKPVDVEDLVRLAASELALRRRGTAVSGRDALPGAGRGDASLVGRWTQPPGFPSISPMFAPGFASQGAPRRPPGFLRAALSDAARRAAEGEPTAADDALILEAEIGGLREALAKIPPPPELALDLGFALDLAGAWAHSAGNVANLLWHHGAMANRPPLPGPDESPRPKPRLAANGKPGAFRRERTASPLWGREGFAEMELEVAVSALKRRDLYPDGAYGVVNWDPDPQTIVNDRADYCAWRLGLESLGGAALRQADLFGGDAGGGGFVAVARRSRRFEAARPVRARRGAHLWPARERRAGGAARGEPTPPARCRLRATPGRCAPRARRRRSGGSRQKPEIRSQKSEK